MRNNVLQILLLTGSLTWEDVSILILIPACQLIQQVLLLFALVSCSKLIATWFLILFAIPHVSSTALLKTFFALQLSTV